MLISCNIFHNFFKEFAISIKYCIFTPFLVFSKIFYWSHKNFLPTLKLSRPEYTACTSKNLICLFEMCLGFKIAATTESSFSLLSKIKYLCPIAWRLISDIPPKKFQCLLVSSYSRGSILSPWLGDGAGSVVGLLYPPSRNAGLSCNWSVPYRNEKKNANAGISQVPE